MNIGKALLILSTLLAVSSPFIFSNVTTHPKALSQFPGWPSEYEGQPLTQLQLTDKEDLFVKGFPGKIARFSDGHRELIIRWVEQPTRKLHPAADCFKGIGYYIKPQPIQVNQRGVKMGCFTASSESNELNVCEFIEAQDGEGWSDVSAWYWGALTRNSSSGWMPYVIAEKACRNKTLWSYGVSAFFKKCPV